VRIAPKATAALFDDLRGYRPHNPETLSTLTVDGIPSFPQIDFSIEHGRQIMQGESIDLGTNTFKKKVPFPPSGSL